MNKTPNWVRFWRRIFIALYHIGGGAVAMTGIVPMSATLRVVYLIVWWLSYLALVDRLHKLDAIEKAAEEDRELHDRIILAQRRR